VNDDLFPSSRQLERLPLQDAEVYFLAVLALPASPDVLLNRLITETPWRAEEILVWGKRHPQPRLIAWYGNPANTYTYSGIALQPLPWTDLLLSIKEAVEQEVGDYFNSVLLNYYRDNRDSMGMHSDDETELGTRPTIASVSLGQERTLVFKHKTSTVYKPVRLPLPSGSLLLMKGDTQRNWKHGINKEERILGPRVNLTFRRIRVPV
jgi:alkylated DNA repair dioxygenase AlkB